MQVAAGPEDLTPRPVLPRHLRTEETGPMTFDWHTWLDTQRQAAARRVGSLRSHALLSDPEWVHALDVANRAARLREALADAEREARSMSPGREQ